MEVHEFLRLTGISAADYLFAWLIRLLTPVLTRKMGGTSPGLAPIWRSGGTPRSRRRADPSRSRPWPPLAGLVLSEDGSLVPCMGPVGCSVTWGVDIGPVRMYQECSLRALLCGSRST